MISPDAAFAPAQSTLLAAEQVAIPGGYIDNAIPRTRLRIRFDAAYENERPDRAEYFYAKCGCFRRVGVDPSAEGPRPNVGAIDPATTRLVETEVDYQDIRLQMEYAFTEDGSLFVELPFRFLNPVVNSNTAGFGDMNFGFKYALLSSPDSYLTFQLRAYAPTGNSRHGLGTDHYSLEPGLLFFRSLSDRLVAFGELKDWIPIDANDGPIVPGGPNVDFSGNIIQYGLGFGYEAYRSCSTGLTVTPVVEFVGWSVLDGLASASNDGTLANTTVEDADDTIVNSKIGVRVAFNDGSGLGASAYGRGSSVYVGWGHALTNDTWYEDILRVEYRLNF